MEPKYVLFSSETQPKIKRPPEGTEVFIWTKPAAGENASVRFTYQNGEWVPLQEDTAPDA